MKLPPDESDCTCDLSQWFHCSNKRGIPDDVLLKSWDVTKMISFVFHHRSNKSEESLEAVEKEKPKIEKKKFREDSDEDNDFVPDDDDKDEDYE